METHPDAIIEAHRRHVWPPYTSNEVHASRTPLVITGAEGARLTASDGRRYLDGNASWWTNNLGHRHPRLVAALTRQAETLSHCALAGIAHEPAALLAKELVNTAPPGLTRVFYSDNGSTAVEVALKMALQYWFQAGRRQRTRFLALPKAFHGDTFGAMAVGGMAEFRNLFDPLLFEVLHGPDPSEVGGWSAVIEHMEQTIADESGRLAGVIVEPLVQGAAGMRVWPPELLGRLRAATRRADTFLIADEVFTGLGRTGTMWACGQADVVPDILCTAKGLCGGMMPFAATLATEHVFEGFSGGADHALMHGHTFCGNPLGASIAREVLAIYREEDVLGQVALKSRAIAQAFSRLATIESVDHVRSLGMVAALDLGPDGYSGNRGWAVYEQALKKGAYLRPLGDTVYIAPPLTIPDGDLRELLTIVEESVLHAVRRPA